MKNNTIQYAQKQSILDSKNDLKLTKIVHIAQMNTDKFRILSIKIKSRRKEFCADKTREFLLKDMNSKSPAGMSIHSISTNWNTPTKYIELIHKMFNVVEFDPCSNSDSIVKARREIILPNDGLKEEWNYRTIFVNPPFGRDFERKTTIKDWIAKCYEANQKYNSEVLLLIPVATNTSHWKEYIFNKASAICFLYDTRLKFRINGSEDNKGCPTACAMIYYGQNKEKFYDIFNEVGCVLSR